MTTNSLNSGLEGLELAGGREGAFGKPNQVMAAFQYRGTKGQAGKQGVIRVDGHHLPQPPKQAVKRVGGGHTPVGPAQVPEAKGAGKHLRVELTEVVGDKHKGLMLRQLGQPFDPQSEPGPYDGPVERVKPSGHRARQGPRGA